MSYINIHTHFKPKFEDEFALRNGYMFALQDDSLVYKVSNGLHPWFSQGAFDASKLKEILLQNKAIAVGECGLDRLRGADLNVQQDIFTKHLDVAHDLKLPVIVHSVRTYDEVWNLVKGTEVPIILHGFSASEQQWEKFNESENVYYSLGIREINRLKYLDRMNLNRILLETDNQLYSIKDVYEEFAKRRGVEVVELQDIVKVNVSKIGIDIKLL